MTDKTGDKRTKDCRDADEQEPSLVQSGCGYWFQNPRLRTMLIEHVEDMGLLWEPISHL